MTKRARPLKAEILEYKQLKAAAGGSGASGGGGTGFRAGETMICKISHWEPNGYAALVPKYNVVGLLVTEQRFAPGEEVSVQFVCISKSRMLLQCRFGPRTSCPDASSEA